MRRLLVTGGGTGGHIYPALAVARAFLAGGAGRRVRFVGSRRGLEAQLVPAADVPFSALPIHGWRGKGPLQRLRFLAELGVALLGALGILLRERPGAVFATGSFASLPVLLAARLARRPIFLQEQNSVPGRVIRLFAGRARAVFIAYEEAAQQVARELASLTVPMGVTGIGYTPADKFGPLAAVCKTLVPQCYATSGGSLKPESAVSSCVDRWRSKGFGGASPAWEIGLAAYRQEGIEGHTVASAMTASLDNARAYQFDSVVYWSLRQIRGSAEVTQVIGSIRNQG